MGTVIVWPACHARSSVGSRAASRAKSSALTPAACTGSARSTAAHHSAGMLSRCHHFETADAPAPMPAAMASREGQSSMIERNEIMPATMGQFVPCVKAIMSRDPQERSGHNVFMAKDDFDLIESAFCAAFQKRLRDIQASRSDAGMAELLGVNVDRYKKWKNRPGSRFPPFLLPRLANIGEMTLRELITGPDQPVAEKPGKQKHARRA